MKLHRKIEFFSIEYDFLISISKPVDICFAMLQQFLKPRIIDKFQQLSDMLYYNIHAYDFIL